jgi:hypothetical protein
MLKANAQKEDMPLFITETGFQSSQKPDAVSDQRQAEAIVKVYVLSIAAGFAQIDWFEARGPAYGHGTDHGIIREDWSIRPAYTALKTMTQKMGAEPDYNGWIALETTGYGFVFGKTLAAWTPPKTELKVNFGKAITVTQLDGKEAQTETVTLTNTPVFLTDIPEALLTQAKENKAKPFPWGKDYAVAQEVSCRLGATNADDGIRQINERTTKVMHGLDNSWKQLDFSVGGEGRYTYFRVDPTFIPIGIQTFEITAVVRRSADGKAAATSILYESSHGYRQPEKGAQNIEDGDWQELKWIVTDANFAGQWGWNFRLEATMSPNEFAIREVRVRKADAKF